jgi:hypothetical protein
LRAAATAAISSALFMLRSVPCRSLRGDVRNTRCRRQIHRKQQVSNKERGKRMVEEMALENVIDTFAAITDKTLTDEGSDGFSRVEGSPDFIIGFDSKPLGIELAEVRGTKDTEAYLDEVSGIAWKKHDSYQRRGLFKNQIDVVDGQAIRGLHIYC